MKNNSNADIINSLVSLHTNNFTKTNFVMRTFSLNPLTWTTNLEICTKFLVVDYDTEYTTSLLIDALGANKHKFDQILNYFETNSSQKQYNNVFVNLCESKAFNVLNEVIKNDKGKLQNESLYEYAFSKEINFKDATVQAILLEHFFDKNTELFNTAWFEFAHTASPSKSNELLIKLFERNDIEILKKFISCGILEQKENEIVALKPFYRLLIEKNEYDLLNDIIRYNNKPFGNGLNLMDYTDANTDPKIIDLLFESREKFGSQEKSDQMLNYFISQDLSVFVALLKNGAKFNNKESASDVLEKHLINNSKHHNFEKLTHVLLLSGATFKDKETLETQMDYYLDRHDEEMVKLICKAHFRDSTEMPNMLENSNNDKEDIDDKKLEESKTEEAQHDKKRHKKEEKELTQQAIELVNKFIEEEDAPVVVTKEENAPVVVTDKNGESFEIREMGSSEIADLGDS